jgi:hypothetical protein
MRAGLLLGGRCHRSRISPPPPSSPLPSPQVLHYLWAYAAEQGLHPHLRLRTRVTSVRAVDPAAATASACASSDASAASSSPANPRRWAVATSAVDRRGAVQPGSEEENEYDAVLVANGHFEQPSVPDFPGQDVFPGVQLHSHNYRRASAFKGQTGAQFLCGCWAFAAPRARAGRSAVRSACPGASAAAGARCLARSARSRGASSRACIALLPDACSDGDRRQLQRSGHCPGGGGGGTQAS